MQVWINIFEGKNLEKTNIIQLFFRIYLIFPIVFRPQYFSCTGNELQVGLHIEPPYERLHITSFLNWYDDITIYQYFPGEYSFGLRTVENWFLVQHNQNQLSGRKIVPNKPTIKRKCPS